jgi:hypothetical protein
MTLLKVHSTTLEIGNESNVNNVINYEVKEANKKGNQKFETRSNIY